MPFSSESDGGLPPRGRPLPFDFFIIDLKALIEFDDGEQHFRPIRFGGMSKEDAERHFKETTRRDDIKSAWAAENGFEMLRIRFDEDPIEMLSEFIQGLTGVTKFPQTS